MPLEVITIPCLKDNYAYIVKGPDGIVLIDAPEAEPLINVFESRGWVPDAIMLTHHHGDHTAGVAELKEKYGCKIVGPEAEVAKLPELDEAVAPGTYGGTDDGLCEVIAVPGHTLGHIAYHYPEAKCVFTGDSLMVMGCGRIFEGTPEMMWDSLSTLAALDPQTIVCSGHEYGESNAAFAKTIEPNNPALISRVHMITAARGRGQPTAQVPLSTELSTNPFLRAGHPDVKKAIGMDGASDLEVFTEIRARKDKF
jgi:hydroxyacylglutathione hydrolase